MKRKHSILSIICVAVAALPISALNVSAADTTVNASLRNTEFYAAQDQDFTTTVYIPQNSNVSSFEAVLNYDASAVTLKSAEACSTESGSIKVNPKNGKVYISYSSTENQTDQINVVDLTFHVVDDLTSGTYSVISLDSSETNNASSEAGDGKATDYKLTSSFTDMTIYQYGDADLNGKIQSRDVSRVMQYTVKMKDLSDLEKIYANAFMDYEEDGTTPKVNSRDAGIIQQKVVKMDVALGNRVNVTFYGPDGNIYTQKSIKVNSGWRNIPEVPDIQGYNDPKWSLKPDEYVAVDFSKITTDTDVYYYATKDPNRIICDQVISDIDSVFAQEGKLISGDFMLPYRSDSGSYNLPTYDKKVNVTWSIDSGTLSSSLNTINYVFKNPELEYTTWVTFNAHIYIDGVKYEIHSFKREIQGKIDMPSPAKFQEIINGIPKELPEHYRLPGYITLEAERQNYDVNTVQNIDICWSVVRNEDGSTSDKRVLDTQNNEIIYLKNENFVTLQADFVFEGAVINSQKIERTIPAKSVEEQIAYAENYITNYIPSVISGDTYLPTTVPLYDITVTWLPSEKEGKLVVGKNETINGVTYKVVSLGEKAKYMEESVITASVERKGDLPISATTFETAVKLAGSDPVLTTGENGQIPDTNLYNALLTLFDDGDKKLTESELYDAKTIERLESEAGAIELCLKDIKDLKGIGYLKNCHSICLAGNDFSGDNAHLEELANLKYLERIDLSNCGINELPTSVFENKKLIEGIDLSYNNLKNVDFFASGDSAIYPELKELFLQGNHITDISGFAFANANNTLVSRIPNVSVLTLNRDLVYLEDDNGTLKEYENYDHKIDKELDITTIGLMDKLTTLWLADNYITDISPLKNCKLLSTLDLSGNRIKADSTFDGLEPLYNLQSLVCLKLDGNHIFTVKSLENLTYLETLSLSNNHIGNVMYLDGMKYLRYLDLDNNSLKTFDASRFPNLERLFLENQYDYEKDEDGKAISFTVDDAECAKIYNSLLTQVLHLDDAPNLVDLRLKGNDVDDATINSISALQKLSYLSLSGNKVEDLTFLSNLTELQHLELADCNIPQTIQTDSVNATTGETKTEETNNLSNLASLTKLETLNLSDNSKISDISSLSSLTNLKIFYINRVKLDNAKAIRSMTKLRYLSMQNSGLKDLSFLNTLNALEYLNLSGHSADSFDFRNIQNCDNLIGLFMDSTTKTTVENLSSFRNSSSLKYASFSNMQILTMDNVPYMRDIVYLGLRNTGIADFNGTFYENDGYPRSINRFKSLKYIDVADNPDLFTKKNLEMLYSFVNDDEVPKSIILYRDDAPEGYIPGVMNAAIEAKRIKNDIDFGEGGTDISEAKEKGYPLQATLNGYDIEWKLSENDNYTVDDGKIRFKNTDKVDENTKLTLTMEIKDLYQKASTPVTFNASIKTTTKSVPSGKTKFVKRETKTSNTDTLDGWILDPELTEEEYTNYGEWSGWSTNAVSESDLRQVETKQENGYTDWGGWSDWSTNAVSEGDLRQVEAKTEQYVDNYEMSYWSTRTPSLVRQFRNFSINGDYSGYGVQPGYGEHHYGSLWISPAELAAAPVIPPGGSQGGSQNGVNATDQNGYALNDGYATYIYFIINTNYGSTTYYRYRDRSATSTTYYRYRDRTKVPAVYHFYRDVYEDIMMDEISGMTLVVEK